MVYVILGCIGHRVRLATLAKPVAKIRQCRNDDRQATEDDGHAVRTHTRPSPLAAARATARPPAGSDRSA